MSGRSTADCGAVVTEPASSVRPMRVSTAASRAVSLRPIPMEAIQVGGAVAASFALRRDSRPTEARTPAIRRKRAA